MIQLTLTWGAAAALGLLFLSASAAQADPAPPAEPQPDATDQAIRANRMGTILIRTRPGARVAVTQKRHEFWFGTAISRAMWRDAADADARRKYQEVLKDNFNAAVHENALKWYSTERQAEGDPAWQDADRMLQWCQDNGIAMRGHCIFWGVEKYVQDWLKALDDDALRRTLKRRALEVTSRYRGRIGEYDVNNEMLHGDYYAKRLGEAVRVDMFRWAREGDPAAALYVNDYNILSGKDVDRYAAQIEGLLKQGAPVGGIGCQGHFGEPVDMKAVTAALDRLAKFNLPIRITEFDLNTGDEEVKARFLGEFYRTCFAHPAVTGILMWGFWEGAHWRPKAALWKKDWTPTPAANVYRDLVYSRWWTRRQGAADAQGRLSVEAFYGLHEVDVDGRKKEVNLRKADGAVELDATADESAAWTVRSSSR